MPSKKLKKYLDDNNIKYVIIRHSPAFTAQEVAGMAHIPGKEMAKSVMVTIEGKMSMIVIPASLKIDFSLLKKVTGVDDIELATEEEFKYMFPDCEIGAMPPFGNLYNIDVWVEKSLSEDAEIAFTACTHSELVKMSYKDFEKLVKPKMGTFALNIHI